MKNGNTGNTTVCRFEVGVPMRSARDSQVSMEDAQRICARKANNAAHKVMAMARPDELTAVICKQFKVAYQILLREEYAPATVSDCVTKGLTPVTYVFSPLDFLSPL